MPCEGELETKKVLTCEAVISGVHPDWVGSAIVSSRHCVPLGPSENSKLVEPKHYRRRKFCFLESPSARYAWRIYTVEGVNSVLGPALVSCAKAAGTTPWLSFLEQLPAHQEYIPNQWTVHSGLPLAKSSGLWWICLCEREDDSGVWYMLIDLLGRNGKPEHQWVLGSDISLFLPVQMSWSFVAKRLTIRCKHVVTDHYLGVVQSFDNY